jgi:hypothetical protein
MAATTKKPSRKERRKARRALLTLLRRLRATCNTINQVSDWYALAGVVETVVNEHYHAIPATERQAVLDALELPEATMDSVGLACRVLQSRVGEAAAAISGTATLGGILLTTIAAVTLVTAAVVLVGALVVNLTAVDLRVVNQGCRDLNLDELPAGARELLALAGFSLPPDVILSGEDSVFSLPPVTVEVDNSSDPDRLIIRGAEVVEIPLRVVGATDIRFNNRSLLGVRRDIDLGDVPDTGEHVLVIACNN